MTVKEDVLSGAVEPGEVQAGFDVLLKPPRVKLAVGTISQFSETAPPWLGDGRGLGNTEGWGVWTVAETASLTLALGEGVVRSLEFRLRPFLVRGCNQKIVTIICNGKPIVRWTFEGVPGQMFDGRVALPERLVGPERLVVITLAIANPRSLKELGISEDPSAPSHSKCWV